MSLPTVEPPIRIMLTPREAASALGISEKHLWSLTQPRGPIPCRKLGWSVRYLPRELEEWAEQR